MNLTIKILFMCLILLMEVTVINNVLHMFQQNRYDYKRFTTWIIKNLFFHVSFKVFLFQLLTLILVYYMFNNYLEISVVILCVISTIYLNDRENKKDYIKPLVFTSRVKRIMTVLYVFNIVGIILILNNNLLFFPLMSFINWFLVYLANLVLTPVEHIIQKGYMSDARKILDSHSNLIKVGITGSFGKTSSKNIVQSIISNEYRSLMTPASYNTPMGITKTIRESLKPIHQVFICEMGADHVNDIKVLSNFVKPSYGIVTSIGPQHLETFGSIENIILEKMRLIEMLDENGVGILNYDNYYIKNYQVHNFCKIITYGIDNELSDYRAVDIKYSIKGSKFKVLFKGKKHNFETKLLGKHNISNILAGIALARELNVAWNDIIKAVRTIDYIEHRLEVKTINGYNFIDNAFNSNPVGASMSLEVMKMMPNKRFIITPGMIDLGRIQDETNYEFGKKMKGFVDVVILVGEKQSEPIKRGLIDGNFAMNNVHVVKTVKEAFNLVYKLADKKDTILLENDLPDAYNN